MPLDEQGINARQGIKQRLLNLKNKYKIQESSEFPGYWAYQNDLGRPEAYIAKDTNVIGPQGLPLIFGCSTFSLDIDWNSQTEMSNFPICGYTAYWDDGHSMYIRFHRKHMKDAISIYKKALELHDSMIINRK